MSVGVSEEWGDELNTLAGRLGGWRVLAPVRRCWASSMTSGKRQSEAILTELMVEEASSTTRDISTPPQGNCADCWASNCCQRPYFQSGEAKDAAICCTSGRAAKASKLRDTAGAPYSCSKAWSRWGTMLSAVMSGFSSERLTMRDLWESTPCRWSLAGLTLRYF